MRLIIDGLADQALDHAQLFTLLLRYFLFGLTAVVFSRILRQIPLKLSHKAEYHLRKDIFAHLTRLDSSYYRTQRTGDLMTRLSSDINMVRDAIGQGLLQGIRTIVVLVFALIVMLLTDRQLASIVYALYIPMVIIFFLILRVMRRRQKELQEQVSELSSFSQESFSGISVLKSFNIQDIIFNKFDSYALMSFKNNLSLAKIQAWFFPIILFLIGLSNLIVIFIGGREFINGNIEIGVIAEFIIYVNMLTWPVTLVGWVTSIVKQAEASQKRINEFLDSKSSLDDGNYSLKDKKSKNIEFKNVSFTYPQTGIEVLNSFNLKIDKGKTIGIVGKVGSGKTTLLDLICRVYDPNEGLISYDKNDIKSFKINNLRELFSYVPQNNFLFSESIFKNIQFGNPNATESEVKKAAKLSEIDSEIAKFESGYQTILGERGVTLSGGQVQRVSIARSFVKDSALYLFDDCFSSLDTDTEERLIKNLKNNFKNKSVIIVSHRVSCVKHADKIIVLEKGKIIQEGTHKNLIKIDGYYKELYNKQNSEIT